MTTPQEPSSPGTPTHAEVSAVGGQVPPGGTPPTDLAATPGTLLARSVTFLKSAKDVLAGITALLAALIWAANYFATAKQLSQVQISLNDKVDIVEKSLRRTLLNAEITDTLMALADAQKGPDQRRIAELTTKLETMKKDRDSLTEQINSVGKPRPSP